MITDPNRSELGGPKPEELSDKEEEFCNFYILHGRNGKEAAIAAGYSEKGPRQAAVRLLHKPRVAARIAQLTQDRRRRIDDAINVYGPEVVRVLGEVALFDVRDVLSEDGKTIDPAALMNFDGRVPLVEVQEILLKGGGTKTTYKFANPVQAASKLADIAGLVKHQHEHKGEVKSTLTIDLFSQIAEQVDLSKSRPHSPSASDIIEPTKDTG